MDWRNLKTPVKNENKLSDSDRSPDRDIYEKKEIYEKKDTFVKKDIYEIKEINEKSAPKQIYTKNKSLHERAQSSEFKAMFN